MGKKTIAELSDEEINALSDDELEALSTAELEGTDGGDAEGEEEEAEGEEEGAEGEEEAEGEEGGEEAGDEGEPLTAEQLAAIANGEGEEEEEDEPDANGMVPRSRLNAVRRREEDLRLILRSLAQQQGVVVPGAAPVQDEAPDADPKPEFDFAGERKKLTKLISESAEEGEIEAQMQRIDDANTALTDWKVRQAAAAGAAQAVAHATATQAQRDVIDAEREMVKEFPFLDSKSKAAFEPAIIAVNTKAKQLIRDKRMAPADALRKAAKDIGGQFTKLLKTPAKAGDADEGKKLPLDGKDPRSDAARKRNLGIRQPATGKAGVGNREAADTLDISQLTDEQIDKLEKTNPAALAKLLGNDRIPG